MFYDNMRTLQNFAELTWPQAKQIIITRPAFPDPYGGRSRESFLSTAPPNVTVQSNDTVNMYAHQFNAGMNRTLTRDIAVTVDVSVTNRYSDRDTIDLNLPDAVTKVKPYPQFGRVNYWVSTADNTYRALLLKVDKRMSNRHQFLVSYTLSNAKDVSSTNLLADRYGFFSIERYGAADRRHRLVTSGIVVLPAELQLSAIADFRSSLRFNPSASFGDLNADGYTGDLPAGIMPGSGCRDLNLDAVNAARTSRGLTAVTTVDCPGFANVDLRLSKTFRLGSRRAELIAQLFNIFNRANFNAPNGNVSAGNDPVTGRPLFGTATTLLPNINAPSRQAEFAVRFQF
jgi:hypothetical protein